jgi:hypothetical protein
VSRSKLTKRALYVPRRSLDLSQSPINHQANAKFRQKQGLFLQIMSQVSETLVLNFFEHAPQTAINFGGTAQTLGYFERLLNLCCEVA